jgi:hypothetical protein
VVGIVTNDPERLSAGRAVDAFVGAGGVASPLASVGGAAWPLAWNLGYQVNSAIALFSLNGFRSPVARVDLRYRVERRGIFPGTPLASVSVAVDGRILGAVTQDTGVNPRVNSVSTEPDIRRQLRHDVDPRNSVGIGVTGIGIGDLPDDLLVNWMLLQVQQ